MPLRVNRSELSGALSCFCLSMHSKPLPALQVHQVQQCPRASQDPCRFIGLLLILRTFYVKPKAKAKAKVEASET